MCIKSKLYITYIIYLLHILRFRRVQYTPFLVFTLHQDIIFVKNKFFISIIILFNSEVVFKSEVNELNRPSSRSHIASKKMVVLSGSVLKFSHQILKNHKRILFENYRIRFNFSLQN